MRERKEKKSSGSQRKLKNAVENNSAKPTDFNPNHNTKKESLGPNTNR